MASGLERRGGRIISPKLWAKGAPVVVRPFGYEMSGRVSGVLHDEISGNVKVLVVTERGEHAFRDRKVRYDGNVK